MEIQNELLQVLWQTRRKKFVAGCVTDSDLGWIVSLGKGKRVLTLLIEVAKDFHLKNLPPEDLEAALRTALNSYLADSYGREGKVMSRINPRDIFSWVRQGQYSQVAGKLQEQIHNQNDIEILLDAHDLSLIRKLANLEFVTNDTKHILKNQILILSLLSLSAITPLDAF
jgi:hypothetical protein